MTGVSENKIFLNFMKITVKTLSQQTIPLQVEPSETVPSLAFFKNIPCLICLLLVLIGGKR